jgi:hypothetical protein
MMMTPSFPGTPYPAVYVTPAPQWQAAPPDAQVQEAPPSRPGVQEQPLPVIARGQIPDDPIAPPVRPAVPAREPLPVVIPSPRELGITSGRPTQAASVDWAALHQRLERLGASSTHAEKLGQDRFRFTCLLPTGAPDRLHRIEAEASSEDEAVRLVLDQAEAWARK